MRNAFWVITQRVVVISYRRFGSTYRSHLQITGIVYAITALFWIITQSEAVGF